jgi:hypothetical protein
MFEQIESMKRQYTDKYVLVDATRPELARFRDVVGRVKTVNMNGRALVEFDEYYLNVGWYDIDPAFLKVVDQPLPKAPKAEAKKPAGKAEAKPAAAKAPAAAAKPTAKGSVADILAAARAGKAPVKPAGETAKAVESKAETAPTKSAAPPKVDRSKLSVADMLAAARAGGAGVEKTPAAKPQADAPVASAAEEAPAETAPAPVAAVSSGGTTEIKPVDKSKMTIDEMVAYCREHDSK